MIARIVEIAERMDRLADFIGKQPGGGSSVTADQLASMSAELLEAMSLSDASSRQSIDWNHHRAVAEEGDRLTKEILG